MIQLESGLFIDGGTSSMPCHATPQWIAKYGATEKQPNGDYAEFTDAGLFLADGVGKKHLPWVASQTAVKAATYRALEIEVPRMPMDEALDAVRRDILPFIDFMIARQVEIYTDEHPDVVGTSTTFEGLFIARDSLVVAGGGDSLSLEWSPSRPLEFFHLTHEQELGGLVTNTFEGKGRPQPGVTYFDARTKEQLPTALTHDEVQAVPIEPDTIYFGMTDGVFGSTHAATRLPQTPQFFLGSIMPYNAPTALQAAKNLVTLPFRMRSNTNLMVWNGESWIPYYPPMDDATAGVLRVLSPQ